MPSARRQPAKINLWLPCFSWQGSSSFLRLYKRVLPISAQPQASALRFIQRHFFYRLKRQRLAAIKGLLMHRKKWLWRLADEKRGGRLGRIICLCRAVCLCRAICGCLAICFFRRPNMRKLKLAFRVKHPQHLLSLFGRGSSKNHPVIIFMI